MAYKIKEVPVRSVYLDNVNPRHDPIDNEPEIISYLMSKEVIRPLAEDIAGMGLSPLERMAVIPHDRVKGAYIALEGNRRFCSLKLLNDPAKAPTPADRKAFEEARASMRTIPKDIEVVIFETREDGRHWLRLRHGGEQGGRGTRQWKAPQKTRFENQGGSGATPNQQALLLTDYALHRNLVTTQERGRLAITTLTRYLSNPSFRDALALNDHRTLTITAPQEQFDVAVKRFLQDSLDGDSTGVNSRSSAEQRKAYATQLRREKVAPPDRLEQPIELDPATGGRIGDTEAQRKKRQRDNQNPDKRTNVIPPEFKAHISDKVQKRLYDELKSIDAEHTFAAAYLFRAFIEQTVKAYLKKNKLQQHGDLHVRIGRVCDALQAAGMTDADVKPFRVMASDKHSQYSPDTLGAFVHGGLIPTKPAVNRAWDNVENLVAVILAGLK